MKYFCSFIEHPPHFPAWIHSLDLGTRFPPSISNPLTSWGGLRGSKLLPQLILLDVFFSLYRISFFSPSYVSAEWPYWFQHWAFGPNDIFHSIETRISLVMFTGEIANSKVVLHKEEEEEVRMRGPSHMLLAQLSLFLVPSSDGEPLCSFSFFVYGLQENYYNFFLPCSFFYYFFRDYSV